MKRHLWWALALSCALVMPADAQQRVKLPFPEYLSGLPAATSTLSNSDKTVIVQGGKAKSVAPSLYFLDRRATVKPGESIQAALTAVKATGGTVSIKAGAYTALAPLVISSNTHVVCEPGAVITANSVGWVHTAFPNLTVNNNALWINENHAAVGLTDSNIRISGCRSIAGGTFAGDGNFFHVYIRRAFRVQIDGGNIFENGGDAVALLATDDTLVADNYSIGAAQCWDHWEAPKRAKVHGGVCSNARFGVFFTGTDTAGTSGLIADDLEVIGGTYILNSSVWGTGGIGIWTMGLAPSAGASHVRIVKPYIDSTNMAGGECVRATGTSEFIDIDAICKGGTGAALNVSNAGDSGGFPQYYKISGMVDGLNTTGAMIVAGSSNGLITNIVAINSTYSYIASGTGVAVKADDYSIHAAGGTSGAYNLTGAGSGVASRSIAYTVGTLPAGATGAKAHVTDALACTFMGALTGGGAVFCPVVYNGSAWVGG